ncbi:MAG TPA: hypothetical protein VG406_06485 [Isosphaeraceae bacterium]|jgi:hypothetical protein|nr:hypothetical protein [Isosphaeraceae bacterium]
MPRATCRCGQVLKVPAVGADERMICPNCGAKVRIKRRGDKDKTNIPGDGFIRFLCPCGRRLKVPADNPPSHGQCPDCGTVVPVPTSGSRVLPVSQPAETPTAELDHADRAALEQWSSAHLLRHGAANAAAVEVVPSGSTAEGPSSPPVRSEAGLRVCPNCSRPVHMGAEACRHCGTFVPKR